MIEFTGNEVILKGASAKGYWQDGSKYLEAVEACHASYAQDRTPA
jgi:hypothetical protein